MPSDNINNINPLNEDHLRQLNEGIAGVKNALSQIDLAVRAGIDVSSQKKSADETLAKLMQIKQVYFPNR